MAQDRALRDIQSMLQARSSNIKAMSLPEPHDIFISDEVLESKIKVSSQRAYLLCHAHFIIWGEMPMQHRSAIECVDELLR